MRDLSVGTTRLGESLAAGERIPSNILAARLQRLVQAGLVEKSGSQPHGRYRLSPRGRTLGPVLRSLEVRGLAEIRWPPATASTA